ncbi:MAG: PH domain-containing protein [Dehalococcoidia bacterium]|nr:PH domain-containing protein [Dehalococcoidia bacterium]
MLLQGQGVTIERPRRTLGVAAAASLSAVAAVLAIALIVKATTWPVSLTQFVAIVSAAVLLVLAIVFAFWAYACYTLHYSVDRNGLTIAWGTIRHYIPMERIEGLSAGRGEDRPDLRGLSWPGLRVGRALVGGKEVLFYSTHRSPEEIVYVRTPSATYAVSPQDPARFMAEVERFRQSAKPGGSETVQRDIVGSHPIWADRVAQLLALAAIVTNLALWGYVFAVYRDLSPQITIEFPPLGEITEVHSRNELLVIPAAALAVLAVNLVAGLAFQWRERAATYLLLSGSVFLQLLFWVSAGIAVANA